MGRRKVALLLKYDFFSTADNSGLSGAERYELLKGLAVYDWDGKIPVFLNPVQTAIFALHKTDIDKNLERYADKARRMREWYAANAGNTNHEQDNCAHDDDDYDLDEYNELNGTSDTSEQNSINGINEIESGIKRIKCINSINVLDIDSDSHTDSAKAAEKSEPRVCEAQKLFITLWQHTPDIFQPLSPIKRPIEWRAFWETSPPTVETVRTAVANFVAGIKSGAIDRRFIPTNPDTFVLNGGFNRYFTPFKSGSNRVPSDAVTDAGQYFGEPKQEDFDERT